MRDAIERLSSLPGKTLREQLRDTAEYEGAVYALAAHCRIPGVRPGRILPDRVYRAVLAFDLAKPAARHH